MKLRVLVLCLALAGCGDNRTVQYFKDHPDERGAVRMRCALGQETGSICSVAGDADREVRAEEQKRGAEQAKKMRDMLYGPSRK